METTSTIVGFRKVEIKDTPAEEDEFGLAGRYYYINGKTVKLKGVNRHESNPAVGHAITRDMMEKEVMLMKRANINHVRNSHYPDDPYWYFLCNNMVFIWKTKPISSRMNIITGPPPFHIR